MEMEEEMVEEEEEEEEDGRKRRKAGCHEAPTRTHAYNARAEREKERERERERSGKDGSQWMLFTRRAGSKCGRNRSCPPSFAS